MKLGKEITFALFKEYLEGRNMSKNTIQGYLYQTGTFFNWLMDTVKKDDIREVGKHDIMNYRVYIEEARDEHGKARYAPSTQWGMMGSLRTLFRFLSRSEHILCNPFDSMDFSFKRVSHIREDIPEDKINEFLDKMPCDDFMEIRDRSIFELLYGTGLRVGEVSRLDLTDIDLTNGRITVIEGKGRKDRIVPIGDNLKKWLEVYLKKARDSLLRNENVLENALFLNSIGRRIRNNSIRGVLRFRLEDSKLNLKRVSPHSFRHSFATHMLNHGAGIKHVKDILGHKSIQATMIYTHFSEQSLKRIMKQYHPRENELYVELKREDIERIVEKIKAS